jgi:hypothetical protein
MKRAALLLLLAGLTGCSTDNAKSLSRDYRNLNNEVIDALMMSTSEWRAELGKDKIIKPYTEKVGNIDKRFATWVQNTDDKEIIRDTLDSESVATLLAEAPINLRRLNHERARITRKVDARAKEHADRLTSEGLLERLRADGVANPEAVVMEKAREETKKEWPVLVEFSLGTGLASLKTQLEKRGSFGELIPKFKNDKRWLQQHPPNFKELDEQFAKRLVVLDLPAQ